MKPITEADLSEQLDCAMVKRSKRAAKVKRHTEKLQKLDAEVQRLRIEIEGITEKQGPH